VISVLVVGEESEFDGLSLQNPSVEVLTAHGVEEALEKLGRNRRIDAVLLLGNEGIPGLVGAIREDNPAHPPIFLPSGAPALPGTRSLSPARTGDLLDLLLREVEG
jgi:hypothetical protein